MIRVTAGLISRANFLGAFRYNTNVTASLIVEGTVMSSVADKGGRAIVDFATGTANRHPINNNCAKRAYVNVS